MTKAPPHRSALRVSHSETTNHTESTIFRYFDYLKLFQPPNMPKSSKINESYLLEACEAAQAQKKPNISKIAREYGVPYATLRDHVKKHVHPRLANKPVNRALKGY